MVTREAGDKPKGRLSQGQILRRADGCDVAERCVECPLRVCRFDLSGNEWQVRLRQVRDLAVNRRCAEGESMAEIAPSIGISEREVYRARARHRSERPDFTDEEVEALLPLTKRGA